MKFLICCLIIICSLLQLIKSSSSNNGDFDLSSLSINGPGLGFAFSNSDSMVKGKQFVSLHLSKCSIGPLDSIYFYIYGCTVPNSFILDLATHVGDGFLYTSDKSLTIVNVTSTSLLLANTWEIQLNYPDVNVCNDEFTIIKNSNGCIPTNSCDTNNIIIGCGELDCTGCQLDNFFSTYTFDEATFILQQ
jgi:hypothetical protein